MALLYGEGENAFMRLYEEIVRRSDEHSIFAWQVRASSCMLASLPKYYQESSNIVPARSFPAEPFALTNKGLDLKLSLRRTPEDEEPSMYFNKRSYQWEPVIPKKKRATGPHTNSQTLRSCLKLLSARRATQSDMRVSRTYDYIF